MACFYLPQDSPFCFHKMLNCLPCVINLSFYSTNIPLILSFLSENHNIMSRKTTPFTHSSAISLRQ